MAANRWMPERFDEIADFWANRLVMESAALDIYGQLAGGSLSAEEVAQRLGLEAQSTHLFLDALTGLGLLSKKGNRYSNSEAAARYLVPGLPDYIGHRLIAAQQSWEMWGHLFDALRSGQRQRDKHYFDDPEAARHSLLALHRDARSRAADILVRGDIDLSERHQMLDLGCGAGTYAVAFCRAHRQLHATLVDRPIAAAIARDVVASAGLEDRISVLEYDVDEHELPSNYDFIWISNVINARSYNANRALFERLYHRLVPGGEVAVHDMIMDDTRTRPARGAVFSVYMLLSNGVGRCYTFQEVFDWLDGSGFHDIRWVREAEDDMTLVIGTR
jgi:cyclopropane fatty-acyl-phospholipid synthase-like methyltransferase